MLCVPVIQDLQATWLLLLYCAATKPNFLFRTVAPDLTEECASAHDCQMWLCCRKIPHCWEHSTPALAQTLPLRQGGLGLRNTVRYCGAAFWSNWVDCLKMAQKCDPTVCSSIASLRRDDQFPLVEALGQSNTEVHNAGLVALFGKIWLSTERKKMMWHSPQSAWVAAESC